MKRFSAIWSKELGEAIKAAAPAQYPVECHGFSTDFKSLKFALNQGIDSHLEASLGSMERLDIIFREHRSAF